MENKRTLRIVLASPGDVTAERETVVKVVAEVDGTTCRNMMPPLALELWRWETDSYPGFHLEGPQGIIDDRLRIDQSDILVGIFRRRFGTPTKDAGSGTEHEIRVAINAWKAHGVPRVMLYFAEDREDGSAPLPDEQYLKLLAFKREIMGREGALVWSFLDLVDLEAKMRRHLTQVSHRIYNDLAALAEPENGLVRVSWRPEIVRIRREGYSELLGTFILEMTYLGRTPPTSPFHVVVLIYLNTVVSSRPGDPVLFEVGRPGANVYLSANNLQGSHIRSGELKFPVFSLEGMLPGETRTFQVNNIRCNAAIAPEGGVEAWVVVGGAIVEKERQRVAVVDEGLRFEIVRSDGLESSLGGVLRRSITLSPTRVATLRFTEGFPNAFKVRLPYGGVPSRADGVFTYCSESSYFGMTTLDSSGQPVASNLADFGTRFEARFNCVPSGVRLFVTDTSDRSNTSIDARFVKPEGSLSSNNLEVDGKAVCELHVEAGTAAAIWEMKFTHRSSGVESLEFGVFVAYEFCPASNTPLPSTVTVTGSFSPSGTSLSGTARFSGYTVPSADLVRIAD